MLNRISETLAIIEASLSFTEKCCKLVALWGVTVEKIVTTHFMLAWFITAGYQVFFGNITGIGIIIALALIPAKIVFWKIAILYLPLFYGIVFLVLSVPGGNGRMQHR